MKTQPAKQLFEQVLACRFLSQTTRLSLPPAKPAFARVRIRYHKSLRTCVLQSESLPRDHLEAIPPLAVAQASWHEVLEVVVVAAAQD
jgi:hypothetical protein